MPETGRRRYSRQEQESLLAQLMEGHQRFLAGDPRPKNYPFLNTLALVQKDVATVLSCSDSRVSPELVFDQGFGDLFVVRSAGHSIDELVIGSLEFAVAQVNSPLLIIMGHEDCRAVHAALCDEEAQTRNLRALVDHIRPSIQGLPKESGPKEAIQAHTRHTAKVLMDRSGTIRLRIDYGDLMLALLYYSVSTGEIEVLE